MLITFPCSPVTLKKKRTYAGFKLLKIGQPLFISIFMRGSSLFKTEGLVTHTWGLKNLPLPNLYRFDCNLSTQKKKIYCRRLYSFKVCVKARVKVKGLLTGRSDSINKCGGKDLDIDPRNEESWASYLLYAICTRCCRAIAPLFFAKRNHEFYRIAGGPRPRREDQARSAIPIEWIASRN